MPKRAPRTTNTRRRPAKWTDTLKWMSPEERKQATEADELATSEYTAWRAAQSDKLRDWLSRPRRWDGGQSYEKNQIESGVIAAAQHRVSAVLASYGVRMPIRVRVGQRLNAWTDFKSIHVEFPRDKLPTKNLAVAGGWTNTEGLRPLLGTLYHECGHVLFTKPFIELVVDTFPGVYNAVTSVSRDDVVARITRGAGALLAEHTKYQGTWNLLEDQRMESLMVADSPIMAEFYTDMVEKLFNVSPELMWAWTAGREYLPDSLRLATRSAYGHDADEALEIISQYKRASTPKAMWRAIVDMHEHLDKAAEAMQKQLDEVMSQFSRAQPGQHKGCEGTHDEDKNVDRANTPANYDPSKMGHGSGESDSKASGQGKSESNKDKSESNKSNSESNSKPKGLQDGPLGDGTDEILDSSKRSETPAGAGAGGGTWDEPEYDAVPKTKEEITAEIQRLIDERQDSDQLQEQLKAFQQDMSRTASTPEAGLRQLPFKKALDAHWTMEGSRMARPLEKALDTATANLAPYWASHQRRGVLVPIDYRTRQPGDLEFNRDYMDNGGERTIDVTVSLVLDMSGSMDGRGPEVGAVDYGVAMACRNLDVPFRSVIFGSRDEYYMLSSSDRPLEPQEPPVLSSTNPGGAIEALSRLSVETTHHLVVVFTDGAFETSWKGCKEGVLWQDSLHTYSICLAEGSYTNEERLAPLFDEAHKIEDIQEIPGQVERFLKRYVRV